MLRAVELDYEVIPSRKHVFSIQGFPRDSLGIPCTNINIEYLQTNRQRGGAYAAKCEHECENINFQISGFSRLYFHISGYHISSFFTCPSPSFALPVVQPRYPGKNG